ncbi:MAG: hypothetical protein K6E93_06775 [Bacteroidales bacterium]|nr:hypothetical protein [Bacteroidales bacterium]
MQHKAKTLQLETFTDNIMADVVLVAIRTSLPIHQFVSYLNDLFQLSLYRKKDINVESPVSAKGADNCWLLPFFVYDDDQERLRYAMVTLPMPGDKTDALFFNCYLYISGENARNKALNVWRNLTEGDHIMEDESNKLEADHEQLRRELRDRVFKADYFDFRQPDAPDTSYFGTGAPRQRGIANYLRLVCKFSNNVIYALLSLIWGEDESFSAPDSSWDSMLDIKLTTTK